MVQLKLNEQMYLVNFVVIFQLLFDIFSIFHLQTSGITQYHKIATSNTTMVCSLSKRSIIQNMKNAAFSPPSVNYNKKFNGFVNRKQRHHRFPLSSLQTLQLLNRLQTCGMIIQVKISLPHSEQVHQQFLHAMEQSLLVFVIVVITKETRHTYIHTALVKDKCYAYCYVKKLICNHHDHGSDMFYSYLVQSSQRCKCG